jgi:hypothetical protein
MYNLEESSLARLAIPDLVTPEQYYDGVRTRHPGTEAIRRLMLAVLEDALRCLQMRANGRRPVERRAMAEAERWIFERGLQGPFTFESVCETLGIHPDHLRDGIRQWRLQLSGVRNSTVPRRDPVLRSGPIQTRLSFSD